MKLFKTDIELKEHIDFVNGFDTKGVAVNEGDVLRDYIKPILGKDLLEELIDAYDAATVQNPISAPLQKLLDKVRPPLARLMFWLWTPEGALNISDNGIGVFKNDQIAPASDAKIDKLDRKYLTSAHSGLDELLEFLEDNKDETDYASWVTSDSFTVIKSFFIQQTKEFKEFVNISGGRTFLQLKPHQKNIEKFTIKPLLGKELYDVFKTWLEEKADNDPFEEALPLIQGTIAHLSFSRALMELSIIEDERGLSLTNTKLGVASQELQAAEKERIAYLINTNTEDGNKYKAELKALLEASTDGQFPGYVKTIIVGGTDPYKNKAESGNYFF